MKKIIPVIMCLAFFICLTIVLIFVIDGKKNIKIPTFDCMDDETYLKLGKYKVSDYRVRYDGKNDIYSFKVKDGKDFYEEMIKKNESYLPDLTFSSENRISGYMLKDNNYFYYEIKNNEDIKLQSIGCSYADDDRNYWYLIAHAILNFNRDLGEYEDCEWENPDMTYEKLICFYNKLGDTYYKVEDEIIYVRDMYDNSSEPNYKLKIYQKDGKIMVSTNE